MANPGYGIFFYVGVWTSPLVLEYRGNADELLTICHLAIERTSKWDGKHIVVVARREVMI